MRHIRGVGSAVVRIVEVARFQSREEAGHSPGRDAQLSGQGPPLQTQVVPDGLDRVSCAPHYFKDVEVPDLPKVRHVYAGDLGDAFAHNRRPV